MEASEKRRGAWRVANESVHDFVLELPPGSTNAARMVISKLKGYPEIQLWLCLPLWRLGIDEKDASECGMEGDREGGGWTIRPTEGEPLMVELERTLMPEEVLELCENLQFMAFDCD